LACKLKAKDLESVLNYNFKIKFVDAVPLAPTLKIRERLATPTETAERQKYWAVRLKFHDGWLGIGLNFQDHGFRGEELRRK